MFTTQDILRDLFGNPNQYERLAAATLQEGDTVLLLKAQPGGIYVCRPPQGSDNPMGWECIYAHHVLRPNAAEFVESTARSLIGESFEIEECRSPDMDGVQIPFWRLQSKAA